MSTKRVFVDILGSSRGAVKAFEETAIAADESSSKIGSEFEKGGKKVEGIFSKLGNTLQANGILGGGALVKMGEKFGQLETKGQKFNGIMSELGKAAALGIGAAAIGIAAEGVHLADGFEIVESQLKTAIKNAGGNFEALTPKINAAYAAGAHFGFTMNEVAGSLAMLTPAAGSPTKALGDLQMAENLARQRGETLGEATQQITSIYGGNVRALKQMGINLNIGSASAHALQQAHMMLANAEQNLVYVQQRVASGQLKGAAGAHALMVAQRTVTQDSLKYKQSQDAISLALEAVNRRTKGAAAAVGTTFAGQLLAAKAMTHNFGVEIGQHLVVFIGHAEVAISKVVDWLSKNKEVAIALAAVVGGVVVTAIGLFVASLFAAEGALAFVIGPVGLVIAAVALLGVGAYELAKHWKTVWHGIKMVAAEAWHFIDSQLIQPIIGGFVGMWNDIKTGAEDIVSFFTTLPGKIAAAAKGMWDGITMAFRTALDTIIGWWDHLHFHIPGFHLGPVHFGGFDLGLPQIPMLAAGGVVTSPTLALIGEGGPEMVIPMSQLDNYGIGVTAAHPLPKSAGGAVGAGAKPGAVEINVTSAHYLNITGDLSSPQAKASLQRALDEHDHELISKIQNVIAA